jgi:parallel beta-helix repeat protein
LSGNNVTENGYVGIGLGFSFSNILSGNNVANKGMGIWLDSSSGNILSGNNVANKGMGIFLFFSSGNIFSGNNVEANNNYGILLDYSSNNSFFHNSFVENTQQVYAQGSNNTNNIWDDGYPSGGNYWSDYNGTDANHDGLGDTPYVIDANDSDRYPLMVPTAIPEFPSLLILPIFFTLTLLTVVTYRRKHH